MKILGIRNAGNPVRVAIFLAEKHLEIPFEPVDLLKGAHRDPAFLAKNPVAQVPVLELDDGTCIAETVAICRYLERLHPEPALMGVDPLDEALVEMWQRRIEFNLYEPARAVFRHSTPFVAVLEPVQLKEWADLNRPRVTQGLEMLDAQLDSHPYVAGPRFTVADITGVFSMQMLPRMRIEIPERCRSLRRWHAEMTTRPSVLSVLGPPKKPF